MARRVLARAVVLGLVALLSFMPLATATAAPQAQEIGDEIIGTWETDLLPSDDSDGLLITASFFEDGSVEALSDYQDGRFVLETGTWEDNGDSTITMILEVAIEGDRQSPYEPPVEVVFEYDGNTLAAPNLTVFGEDGLVFFFLDSEPTDLAAIAADAPPPADDDDADDADDVGDDGLGDEATDDLGDDLDDELLAQLQDIPGVYISNEIDADGFPGLAIVYLAEDGSAQSLAVRLDQGESPSVSRVGSWEEDDDGVIVMTFDQELVITGEEVETEELEEPETLEFENRFGLLVTELLTLFPVDEIEYYMDVDEAADDLDDLGDDALDDTLDDTLDDDLSDDFGDDLGSGSMYMSPMSQIMAGNVVVVLLLDSGLASMSTQLADATEGLIEGGEWEEDTDGNIVLTLTEDEDGNQYAEPYVLVFEQTDGTTLTGIDYDTERYGEELVVTSVEE